MLLCGPLGLGLGSGHIQSDKLADRHDGSLGQEMMLAVSLRIMMCQLDVIAVEMVHDADVLAIRANDFHMLFDLRCDFFGGHNILL